MVLNLCRDEESPWIYRSSVELKQAPYAGTLGVYKGGGYTFTFKRTREKTERLLKVLRSRGSTGGPRSYPAGGGAEAVLTGTCISPREGGGRNSGTHSCRTSPSIHSMMGGYCATRKVGSPTGRSLGKDSTKWGGDACDPGAGEEESLFHGTGMVEPSVVV